MHLLRRAALCSALIALAAHAQTAPAHGSKAGRRSAAKSSRRADETNRRPKLGSQQRFDVSANALRARRSAKADSLP